VGLDYAKVGPAADFAPLAIRAEDVVGNHPGLLTLPRGFAYIVVGDQVRDCVTRSFLADDERVNTGKGGYLVTATLHCLGLAVQPKGTVAYARAGPHDQASLIYGEASESSPFRRARTTPPW
jgi:hypothetical protein